MRYRQELLGDIVNYSKELGLDERLIHASKTKAQADTLLSITNAILKYDRVSYQNLKTQNDTIKDPYRDLTSIIDKIDGIENYISKYHDGLSFYVELKQLQDLKNKLHSAYRLKTKDFVDLVMNNIEKELLDNGFSKQIIIKGSKNTQALKTIFKSLLTE